MWRLPNLLRMGALGLVIWAIFILGSSQPSWDAARRVTILGCTAILLGVVSLIIDGVRQRKLFSQPDDEVDPLSYADVRAEMAQLGKTTDEAVDTFITALLTPKSLFMRISESATPVEGHISMSTRFGVRLPEGAEYPVMLPLLLQERGRTFDGLKIFDGQDKRLSSESQLSAVAFYANAVRVLIGRAGGSSLQTYYAHTVEYRVISLLTSQTALERQDFDELLATVGNLRATSDKPENISKVELALWQLRTHYPLLVRLGSSTSRLRVEQDVIIRRQLREPPRRRYSRSEGEVPAESVENRSATRSWLQRIRSSFANVWLLVLITIGVRPNDVSIPLDISHRARSYHLQCEGPEGTYLGDQELALPRAARKRARVKGRHGQSFSHLYISDPIDVSGRYFRNWFFEIPPGSVGLAAAIGFATLFGLVAMGLGAVNWVSGSANLGSANVLLGLPAAFISFLGINRTAGFLRGSTLARLSIMVSLVSSLVGIGIAIVMHRTLPSGVDPAAVVELDLRSLKADLVPWLVLTGAQAANLAAAAAVWIFRTVVYWFANAVYPADAK